MKRDNCPNDKDRLLYIERLTEDVKAHRKGAHLNRPVILLNS